MFDYRAELDIAVSDFVNGWAQQSRLVADPEKPGICAVLRQGEVKLRSIFYRQVPPRWVFPPPTVLTFPQNLSAFLLRRILSSTRDMPTLTPFLMFWFYLKRENPVCIVARKDWTAYSDSYGPSARNENVHPIAGKIQYISPTLISQTCMSAIRFTSQKRRYCFHARALGKSQKTKNTRHQKGEGLERSEKARATEYSKRTRIRNQTRDLELLTAASSDADKTKKNVQSAPFTALPKGTGHFAVSFSVQ